MRISPSPVCGSFFLVLCLATGCANQTLRMASGSVEAEREIGDKQAKAIHSVIGLDREPKVSSYVEAVGQRLAAQAHRKDIEYRFYIVDMAVPNAFALPGGHVYVSRGLLALVNSEDELAGALGHEMGHVEARHAIKRSQVSVAMAPVQIAAGLTGLAASIISHDLGSGISNAPQYALAPYSRDQEREADRIGQDIAARAGYDARGLSMLLATMSRQEKMMGGAASDSFLETHPATPERVQATAMYAATLVAVTPDPIAKDRAQMLSQLDGLLLGDNPMKGLFLGNLFLQPWLGLRISFPPKWQTGRASGAVGARSPDKDAAIFLRPVAVDRGLATVVREQEERAGVKLLDDAQQVQINGLSAIRKELATQGGKEAYWLSATWVQVGRTVWSILAVAPLSRKEEYASLINASVEGFGRLGEAERAKITATRLRLTQALSGESIEFVKWRTHATGTANQLAIANGVDKDTRFKGGELLKIFLDEAFVVSASPTSPTTP
jgi:predicted Zn-dependent protease